jgi:cytochrome b561
MLITTRQSWGSLARTLHWLISLQIVLEVPAGYLMSYTYGLSFHDRRVLPLHNLASQIHHTNGLLILVLVATRLSLRLASPTPAPQPDRFPGQGGLSRLTHGALYGLLFALPLSGWAALSVLGLAPIWLFNLSGVVPAILPRLPLASPLGYGLFAHIHLWALYIGAVALSAHAAAALWHHFVLRDNILLRMWPLARSENRPGADDRSQPLAG